MNPQGPGVTEHVSGRCHSHGEDRPLWALHFSLLWQGAFLKAEDSQMPKIVTKCLQCSELFQESPKLFIFLINSILPSNLHAI